MGNKVSESDKMFCQPLPAWSGFSGPMGLEFLFQNYLTATSVQPAVPASTRFDKGFQASVGANTRKIFCIVEL